MKNTYLTIFYDHDTGGYPVDTVKVIDDREYRHHYARFMKWIKEENPHVPGKYVIMEHENFPESYTKCA